ncbi:MAG: hypothetical protein HY033_10280 [Ignavibacteriae bacterium]|nr:hypothetical protein [Ignavibacteria bacterium]MBI3365283.1 hypothetical protein [Ignavibacteriota bacterium]
MMIKQCYFDKPTALSKVGKKIQSLVEFAGVPRGTTGRVMKADAVNHSLLKGTDSKLYDLAIEWDIHDHCTSLVDWFTKVEYEQFLVEVDTNI